MTRKAAARPVTKQDTLLLRRAVGRWENEGGAETSGAEAIVGAAATVTILDGPRVDLTNAELVQLQLRVIALENLVTALLAMAPDDAAGLVRALAAEITPRSESTPHHLTIRAAAQMIHLLERGELAEHSRRRGAR